MPAYAAAPDDSLYPQQRNLHVLDFESAWDRGFDGSGVRIAVIDSGIFSEHTDLRSARIATGVNVLEQGGSTGDASGHGTFISAMLAAPRGDGKGLAGMVDKALIIPIKCFASGRQTNAEYIVSSIYLAVDQFDCDVINLSIGIGENLPQLRRAVDYAVRKGVIVVASVGNTGGSAMMYPAAYDDVVGVGSVSSSFKPSYFSQHNSSVFVVAPGEDILSAGIDSESAYMNGSGTSFSSVHVTALAAMAKQYSRDIGAAEFMNLLKLSARDLGAEGYDTTFGWGVVNAGDFAAALCRSAAFSDISGHWAEVNIVRCLNLGIFSGVSDELFMPDEPLSRAMAVTALHRLAGSPAPQKTAGFSDVPPDSWYRDAVMWASENGIVSGVGGGLFEPGRIISREELAVLFCRYAASRGCDVGYGEKTRFADSASIDVWAKQSVYWCADRGLITGLPDGSFNPRGSATRADTAVVISRFIDSVDC